MSIKTFFAQPAWVMPDEAIEAASQNFPFDPAGDDFAVVVHGECHNCDHTGAWPVDLEVGANNNLTCFACAELIEESAS